MVYIKLEDKDKISIKFYSENYFFELLNICKIFLLKYNHNDKKWYGSKNVIFYLVEEIEKIEEIFFCPTKEVFFEKCRVNLDIKNNKLRFFTSVLKSKPIGAFQIEGIKKLIEYNRFLLADDTGAGKSYQIISAINHYWYNKKIDRLLIITLNQSITYNWKRELRLFANFINNVDEEVIIVNKNNRSIFDNCNQYKCIITDYNTFRLIFDYYSKEKKKSPKKNCIPLDNWVSKYNRCIVLDEGHAIKNRKSQVSKKIKLIRDFFYYRYILSATPAPNLIKIGNSYCGKNGMDISEMFSLFEFLDSKLFNLNYNVFKNVFFEIGTSFSNYAINYMYENKYFYFLDKIKPYVLRRLKKDVLPDLPELTIKKIYVQPNNKQIKLYSNIIQEEILKIVDKNNTISYRVIKNKFSFINLICSDVSLIKKEDRIYSQETKKLVESWSFLNNSKLEICNILLSDSLIQKTDKCIIWSFHPKVIDQLVEYYKKYNPVSLHGETKIVGDKGKYINNLIKNFETDEKIKLGIFNPLCLGTGVNLKFCNYNIFFDRNFDVKSYLQACGRSYRANSEKPVVIYNLILDNTIEVYLDKILDQKENLNNYLSEKKHLTFNEICSIITGEGL